MIDTSQGTSLPICPRCRSNASEVRGVSPKPGVWTVFGCNTCFYVWRSTEPEENTDPDKFPAVFRLTTENLSKLTVAPAISALRQIKS